MHVHMAGPGLPAGGASTQQVLAGLLPVRRSGKSGLAYEKPACIRGSSSRPGWGACVQHSSNGSSLKAPLPQVREERLAGTCTGSCAGRSPSPACSITCGAPECCNPGMLAACEGGLLRPALRCRHSAHPVVGSSRDRMCTLPRRLAGQPPEWWGVAACRFWRRLKHASRLKNPPSC